MILGIKYFHLIISILFEEGLRVINFELDIFSNSNLPTPIAAGTPIQHSVSTYENLHHRI